MARDDDMYTQAAGLLVDWRKFLNLKISDLTTRLAAQKPMPTTPSAAKPVRSVPVEDARKPDEEDLGL